MNTCQICKRGTNTFFSFEEPKRIICKSCHNVALCLAEKLITVTDLQQLNTLVSRAIDGTEHGVCTHEQWKTCLQEVKTWFSKHGLQCHGQWTTY